MITKEQILNLSRFYQIDTFTILREYLQLVFLDNLYRMKGMNKIFFKGGTAIRILFGSPRFSEDLDFSTTYPINKIKEVVKKIEVEIQKEIPSLKILPLYSDQETERFRIKYEGKEVKYPLTIRLDFHRVKKIGKTKTSAIRTKFPIIVFPLITHLTAEEILKEKIEALIDRVKGRDFFDVWYLLEKKVPLPKKIPKNRLLEKIKQTSEKKLIIDLTPFLPKNQRGILKSLKRRLMENLINKYGD